MNSERIVWAYTPPLEGDPTYPVVLDIAESLKSLLTNSGVRSACSSLAPTYEELKEVKLVGMLPSIEFTYHWAKLNERDYFSEKYLLLLLARAIGSLGSKFGVVLHNPERYDPLSQKFVNMLIHHSKSSNFHVVIDSGIPLSAISARNTKITQEHLVNNSRYSNISIELNTQDLAIQLISLCPRGIPFDMLESLVGSYDISSLCECTGLEGKRWAFLPKQIRKYVCSKIPTNGTWF